MLANWYITAVELITIAEFYNATEAYLLKSRLEAESIDVFLQNENLGSILPAGFNKIKVQTSLADSFKAMDILYAD